MAMPITAKQKKDMLFTLLLEFDGVNSVSQLEASSESAALLDWIRQLEHPERFGLDEKQGVALRRAFQIDEGRSPTPLAERRNVWCTTALAGKKLVLLNIVATVSRRSREGR
jgi:hypothetical protein